MSPLVEKTLQDIFDDYERSCGNLRQFQVEQILNKRALSAKEIIYIYKKLADKSIKTKNEEIYENFIHKKWNAIKKINNKNLYSICRDISKYKLLTTEDEKHLGCTIQIYFQIRESLEKKEILLSSEAIFAIKRGLEARNIFILSNLRLVVQLAKSYNDYLNLNMLEDIIQEGIIGLIRAVEKFDHSKGYKFSTYATHWIRQSIMKKLSTYNHIHIHIPLYMSDSINKLRKAEKYMVTITGNTNISIKELANELGWDIEKTYLVKQASSLNLLSIDKSDSSESYSVKKFLSSSFIHKPDEAFEKKELIATVKNTIEKLSKIHADIIIRRFGLGENKKEETLEEIGFDYKLTRERIRQIESEAIERLKHFSISKNLKDFLE